jgi:hypothetical protein
MTNNLRHGRAKRVEDARERAFVPGHPRLSFRGEKDVDARREDWTEQ